ncbi:MAG TPA: S41 family peptidase [Candidatus Omnitrophota bacterium]|nr:S41 family peptidase [Candidatus Omnitrophota bacterium]HPT38916.1 S41 family peptidase [Candidatus Omnitrophota bacterium]
MRKNIVLIFLLAVLVLAGVRLGFSESKKKNNDKLYKQVEIFSDTLAIVQKEYVDETKTRDLIYGALKGMLESLDPHSQFMDPEAYEELRVDTQGKFGGLGIEITIKDGLLTVITPIEDTPAWKAGVKAGDRIVKINDALTREMSLTEAVKKMRGKPGTLVDLTILRDSEKKLLEFKITRDIIKITDIKYVRILESGVGYIRLSEFRENTLAELNNALSILSKEGMQSLIIDLRNNPGGLLDVAVKVTGKFLPPNKLVAYTKSRQKDQDLEFFSEDQNTNLNLPLVILINEGSASGSEIVAGALQDYKRAIIIGKKSFGKGSVQTVIPLNDGSALRLTTSHYFTPSGKIIQGKGITPDITVEDKKIPDNKVSETGLKNSDEIFDQVQNMQQNDKPAKNDFNYKTDTQLMRAVEALKAIEIYKQVK